MVRLETRAGELTVVASLRAENPQAKENQHARNHLSGGQVRGLKGPGVTAVKTRNRAI